MTSSLLYFTVLIVGWWAALWFALPVDLQQQSVPSLAAWHFLPPVLVITAWSLFKYLWIWRINRRVKAGEDARENERLAALEAAKVASLKELARRREHVECRAAWAIVPKLPGWYKPTGQGQSLFLEARADRVCGAGREAALAETVRRIFVTALVEKNAALTWLPVYVVPGQSGLDGPTQLRLLEQAWRDAVDSLRITPVPSAPDCQLLSGTGSVIERVFALFETEPTLPAILLLGMDSPLADAVDDSDGGDESPAAVRRPDRPGHAVAALLLSRPGLTLPEGFEAALALENKDIGPYTPYWEREREENAVRGTGMGRVPLSLQPDLLALKPFAAFPRFRSLEPLHERKIPAQLEALLVDAGLNDPPAGDKGAESDEPEFGWLVHNGGNIDGDSDNAAAPETTDYLAITRSISKIGGKLDACKEASNLGIEHGEVGAARSVLMLAEGLIRVGQLKKPVLIAEFSDGGDRLEIGLSRPLKAY